MSQKIFVVEDTQILADSLAETLRMEGYEVCLFYHPLDALGELQKTRPALIISDLEMPGINGLEFIGRIRSVVSPVRIPVIILTADAKGKNELKARQAGADLLLHKPFDYDVLMAAIKNLLS